ncbi:hypothetical protein SRABI96_02711 [Peribacillus sp. Bi96]|nr:hypothetical protein SRABI96_02711 [Peribacillus sp. Bi96]
MFKKRTIDFGGWFWTRWAMSDFRSGKAGEMYIVFVQTETRFLDIPYHRGRVGLNHLVFHATSRQLVDEITRKVRNSGVTILYADKHPSPLGRVIMLYISKIELAAP